MADSGLQAWAPCDREAQLFCPAPTLPAAPRGFAQLSHLPDMLWQQSLPETLNSPHAGLAPTGLGHMPWVTPQSLGPLGQPEPPSSKMLPSPGLLSTPAQDSPANSSRAPGPLDPSPVEEGFPVDLLPARNASWEVGNWSQASAAGVRAGRCVCRVGGVLTESRQSRVCPAFWGVRAQELTACGGWSLCG